MEKFTIGPPFRSEPDEVRLLFEYVGRLSVHFAVLETALDVACLVAFNSLSPRKKPKRLPTKFSDKLRLLDSCVEQFAQDDVDASTATGLLDRFKDASERRNNIVHPLMVSVSKGLDVTGHRFVRGESTLETVPVAVSIREIEDLTREVHHLGQQAGHLAAIVCTAAELRTKA